MREREREIKRLREEGETKGRKRAGRAPGNLLAVARTPPGLSPRNSGAQLKSLYAVAVD